MQHDDVLHFLIYLGHCNSILNTKKIVKGVILCECVLMQAHI